MFSQAAQEDRGEPPEYSIYLFIYEKFPSNMTLAYSYFYCRTTNKRWIVGDFLQELAAMLKAFAILAALANTVFASSLAEPSARCEVIEVALLSN